MKHHQKITIIMILIILICLVLLHYKLTYSCVQDKNKWYLDQDEILSYQKENDSKTHYKTHYLFWTGGLDSTFRLCQIVLDQKEKVQPIYILCRDLDSESPAVQRKNRQMEIKTMKKIRSRLHLEHPKTKSLILPTMYVTGVQRDLEVLKDYQTLRKEYGHFPSRTITQYERIARFSLHFNHSHFNHSHFNHRIEVGLEKCGTGLDRATNDKRTSPGVECILRDKVDKPFRIFSQLKFPMAHLTKKDYLEISRQNGYYQYLQITWSCWYPTASGRSCGKCDMCKKRII